MKEIKHLPNCFWGGTNCEFKETHEYCPHEEHKSLDCICFEMNKENTPCPCTNCTSPRNAELKEVKFRLEELLFYIKKIMEEDEK